MKLPLFEKYADKTECVVRFGGIDRMCSDGAALYDAVNLTGADKCHTRKARKAVMFSERSPDQVINCSDRLFFRFGNSLNEIHSDSDGSLYQGKEYALKELDPSPDRIVLIWQDDICVLPDGIKFGGDDVWNSFGADCSVSAAMPFTGSRTLFYTSGYSGGEFCGDSEFLKPGVIFRFSWLGDEVFTVVSCEEAYSATEEGYTIFEGVRVTLDRDVSGYSSLSQSASVEYCLPKSGNLLKSVHIGYNEQLTFSGTSIKIASIKNGMQYKYPISEYLRVGQRVKISGALISANNITAQITDIAENYISVDAELISSVQAAGNEVIISPVIPDFDHALITEDRLFGADNSTDKFYISELYEPFIFYDDPKETGDAWSVTMNEKATGLTLWKDNIICFTERGGFRILGYTALNFGVRQLSLSGIKAGAEGSLIRIGDTLFYCSERGIMKYSGGSDKRISSALPEEVSVSSAVSGGRYGYMLSGDRIWVYDPDNKLWWSENAENITYIFAFSGNRYLCSDNAIYLSDGDGSKVKWSFKTAELPWGDEKQSQPVYCDMRVSGETGAEFSLYIKPSGSAGWERLCTHTVKGEKILRLPLKKVWCNGFSIKAKGSGDITLHRMTVFYRRK